MKIPEEIVTVSRHKNTYAELVDNFKIEGGMLHVADDDYNQQGRMDRWIIKMDSKL